MVYTLEDFNNISFNGFDFKVDETTINLINKLSSQVGSPTYIKTPVFKKQENGVCGDEKKGKYTKDNENINDDWKALRNFQTTKIEKKEGIHVQIDLIRSHLNKISNKNYDDFQNKIIGVIDEIVSTETTQENLFLIGKNIFEIASNNRFYSKIYADLYFVLIKKYKIMETIFQESFDSFLDIFNTIEYVNPNVNYDKFCNINKNNEKRKCLSAFFVNLTGLGLITKEKLLEIIQHLLCQVKTFIIVENKKEVVDEIMENIYILYQNNDYKTDTINEIIKTMASIKDKITYPSLSQKSIFKCMDISGM
jgi:hypothetical protein